MQSNNISKIKYANYTVLLRLKITCFFNIYTANRYTSVSNFRKKKNENELN